LLEFAIRGETPKIETAAKVSPFAVLRKRSDRRISFLAARLFPVEY
jgi:hypothetical protein